MGVKKVLKVDERIKTKSTCFLGLITQHYYLYMRFFFITTLQHTFIIKLLSCGSGSTLVWLRLGACNVFNNSFADFGRLILGFHGYYDGFGYNSFGYSCHGYDVSEYDDQAMMTLPLPRISLWRLQLLLFQLLQRFDSGSDDSSIHVLYYDTALATKAWTVPTSKAPVTVGQATAKWVKEATKSYFSQWVCHLEGGWERAYPLRKNNFF